MNRTKMLEIKQPCADGAQKVESAAARKRARFVGGTRKTVYIALLAALTAAMSQISIPLPSGVPLTLQTFAVAFAAFFIGWKSGAGVIVIYILLGAAGAPVFSSFTGGFYKLIGLTGGFIWGFIPMVLLAGLFNKYKMPALSIAGGVLGLFVCHLLGAFQFAAVADVSFAQSAATVSLPFIAKDILSVALAYFFARTLKNRLRADF